MAKSNPQGRNAVIQSANDEAFRRMTEADPVLIDVAPARDVVPGFANDVILTSGPPLPWSEYEGGSALRLLVLLSSKGLQRPRRKRSVNSTTAKSGSHHAGTLPALVPWQVSTQHPCRCLLFVMKSTEIWPIAICMRAAIRGV